MEREMHALYEGAIWSQKFVKSFKLFLFTDHKNNTFRSKIQPTRRVTKKLLKMCIELEPLGIERVYIAGEDNILGDAPSRAPADREVARNLAAPLAPIKEIIHRMFWAPDEVKVTPGSGLSSSMSKTQACYLMSLTSCWLTPNWSMRHTQRTS